MFELYKKRSFGDYINDSFKFFKIYGKHYFKNYFTINGSFLLLLMVLMYFFFKIYLEFIFTTFNGNQFNPENQFASMIQNNIGLIITAGIFGFLLILTFTILQFTFPVIYLDLVDKNKGQNFTTKDIVSKLKKQILRILIFVLGSIFIIFPVLIIVFTLNILLCFILIGFPLFLVTIPAIASWISISYYHYISGDGFFLALQNGFYDLTKQFYAIVFSTLIVYILLYIINLIFTMIPYMIGIASIYTSSQTDFSNDRFSTFSIMMIITLMISMLAGFIMNNLLLVQQGLVFYSQRENNDSISTQSEIELIGTPSE